MRKIFLVMVVLLVLGGGTYFVYSKVGKSDTVATNAVVKEDKKEKETIHMKDAVEVYTDIPTDKVWDYLFEPGLDKSSLSDENIFVLDEKGQKVKITYELINEGTMLRIYPPAEGYEEDARYQMTMSDDLKKVTGANVSRNYEMQFITKSKEVENGVLNPEIKMLKKEQATLTGENELLVDKDVTLVKDDIFIIPTEEYPDGQALKVTKVESEKGNYTVKVKKPEFGEIFESLDLNKSYLLNETNIILDENVEGIEIKTISGNEPTAMVGTSTVGGDKDVEFKTPESDYNISIDDGFVIDFSNYQLNPNSKKYKVGVNGNIKIFSPEVKPKVKKSKGKIEIDRIELKTIKKAESDITIQSLGKEINEDVKLKDMKENIKLGKIRIPIGGISGLSIEGNLMVKFEYSLQGGVETKLNMDFSETAGFVYEDGNLDPIFQPKAEFDTGIQGKGKAEGRVGPALNVLLSAYGVAGAGLEVFGGAEVVGEGLAGTDTENGSYACFNLEENVFIEAAAVVDVLGNTVKEWDIADNDFGFGVSKNTCQFVDGFVPIKVQKINAGESKSLSIKTIKHNLLNDENKNEQADMKKVDVSTSDKGVIKVQKTKTGISITAEKDPTKEKVNINIKQEIDGEKHKLVIPVTINNFKEVQEAKKKAEEEKKPEVNNWDGEWTRVSVSNPGTLTISNYNGKTLDIVIDVLSGGNTSGIEGKATIEGDQAILVDNEFECRVDLTLNKDSITVGETQGCTQIGGIGTFFSGEYKNKEATAKTPKQTLSSLNIIAPENDTDIQKLLGDDYNEFVSNMQLVSDARAKYGREETLVIEGGVRGLYTIKEGIIVMDPFKNYYIGSIVNDGEKVKFYTNDAAYKTKVHDVVDQWRQDFSDYPVEIVYKKIQ